MATNKPAGHRRSLGEQEEDRVWAEVYRTVSNPAIATEVKALLDEDPQYKEKHLGLYLRCRTTLRIAKQRQDRVAAIRRGTGVIVRWLCWPVRIVAGTLRFVGELAVPVCQVDDEPAVRTVRRLSKKATPSGQQDKQVKQSSAVKDETNSSDVREKTPEPDGRAQASVK